MRRVSSISGAVQDGIEDPYAKPQATEPEEKVASVLAEEPSGETLMSEEDTNNIAKTRPTSFGSGASFGARSIHPLFQQRAFSCHLNRDAALTAKAMIPETPIPLLLPRGQTEPTADAISMQWHSPSLFSTSSDSAASAHPSSCQSAFLGTPSPGCS
jgi:hypothetical protein